MNSEPHYTVEHANNIVRLVFYGEIARKTVKTWRNFHVEVPAKADTKRVILDINQCLVRDSSCIVVLQHLQQQVKTQTKATCEFALPKQYQQGMPSVPSDEDEPAPKKQVSAVYRTIETIGARSQKMARDTRDFIDFFGQIVQSAIRLMVRPHRMRWKDFPLYFAQAGVFAVPIILIVGGLIGVIIGYQGAMQLKMFGADRFLADLVGISVTRELGPLIAAILISGRSGAAFAAEIGTMKVGEEISSLRSIGVDTMLFLIWPRMVAVMLAAPLLTMLCIVAAIAGGMAAGLATLDITVAGFVTALHEALPVKHLLVGLGKSVVFGMVIAIVGAFRGMQVSGGAEAVGRFTTSAVVTCILFVILLDAVFAIVLQTLGV